LSQRPGSQYRERQLCNPHEVFSWIRGLLERGPASNQIITDYEVYPRRPYDSDLLVGAIETPQALLGRAPRLVAADAAFYSAKNEAAAKAKGVKRCEGRISVVKRRHGLDRCRYKGSVGMDRWVGLGVIADSVVNIGRAPEKRAAP
jgi:IS5 family transposase